ncbi:MAG: hypothetical protein ACRD88_22955 [Terriglobia bacterium]
MKTTSFVKAMPLSQPDVGLRRRFYIGVSLLMGLTAITGFWPTYFGPLVRGTIEQPLLIHVHATVFAGWLALFLAQATLAAAGHVSWHQQLGRAGIGYGFLLIAVGLFTTVLRSAGRVISGENAAQLLYVGFVDMLLFASFFGAAVRFRRKPEWHRRLMLVAATILLVAAVGRMPFLRIGPLSIHLRLMVWSLPILLAIAYDFRSRRPFHPVYALGLAALAVRLHSVPLSQTVAWSAVTQWVTGLVL